MDEADNARDEARELLEQHRQLDRGREGRGGTTSSRTPARSRDAQIARVKEEAEAERAAPARGDASARSTPRRQRALDQIRSEVADLTLEATARVTGKVLDADGPAPAHRRGDRRSSTSPRSRRSAPNGGRAAHLRPRALRGRAKEAGRVDGGRDRPRRARGRDRRGAGAPLGPAQPAGRARRRRRRCSTQLAGDADELVRNFVRLVAEKGRAGELAGGRAGVRGARRAPRTG